MLADEISSKYTAVVTSMADDVTPFLDLMESELSLLERQLESVFRAAEELYRDNELLQSLGQELWETAELLRYFVLMGNSRLLQYLVLEIQHGAKIKNTEPCTVSLNKEQMYYNAYPTQHFTHTHTHTQIHYKTIVFLPSMSGRNEVTFLVEVIY